MTRIQPRRELKSHIIKADIKLPKTIIQEPHSVFLKKEKQNHILFLESPINSFAGSARDPPSRPPPWSWAPRMVNEKEVSGITLGWRALHSQEVLAARCAQDLALTFKVFHQTLVDARESCRETATQAHRHSAPSLDGNRTELGLQRRLLPHRLTISILGRSQGHPQPLPLEESGSISNCQESGQGH